MNTTPSRPPELSLIVIRRTSNDPPTKSTIEEKVKEIADDNRNEWHLTFLKDIYQDIVPIQDEVPPTEPVDLPATIISLEQIPVSRIEPGDIYDGPPITDDPLHDLAKALLKDIDNIEIWIDALPT